MISEIERSGVPGIAVDGDLVRMTIFPEAGAKILDLVHVPTGFDLLWKNPRVPLARTYPGAAFDDVWCGGWDELFPTDPPCAVGVNTFHDHGDLWHGPWDVSVVRDDADGAELHLRRHTVALPCLMEKWVTLRRDEPVVRFRHRLTNLGAQAVQFAWSLHVAHAIEPDSRIHLPVHEVTAVPGQAGRFAADPGRIEWPTHGTVDVDRAAPAESGLTEWLYPPRLENGWCGVTHPSRGVGLLLDFDEAIFRTVWLWGVYGGWRGHYVLLTEPSTSPPGGLAQNVADGTAAELAGGGVLETEVTATVLDDPARLAPD